MSEWVDGGAFGSWRRMQRPAAGSGSFLTGEAAARQDLRSVPLTQCAWKAKNPEERPRQLGAWGSFPGAVLPGWGGMTHPLDVLL